MDPGWPPGSWRSPCLIGNVIVNPLVTNWGSPLNFRAFSEDNLLQYIHGPLEPQKWDFFDSSPRSMTGRRVRRKAALSSCRPGSPPRLQRRRRPATEKCGPHEALDRHGRGEQRTGVHVRQFQVVD